VLDTVGPGAIGRRDRQLGGGAGRQAGETGLPRLREPWLPARSSSDASGTATTRAAASRPAAAARDTLKWALAARGSPAVEVAIRRTVGSAPYPSPRPAMNASRVGTSPSTRLRWKRTPWGARGSSSSAQNRRMTCWSASIHSPPGRRRRRWEASRTRCDRRRARAPRGRSPGGRLGAAPTRRSGPPGPPPPRRSA
jgi:hypothetical protein